MLISDPHLTFWRNIGCIFSIRLLLFITQLYHVAWCRQHGQDGKVDTGRLYAWTMEMASLLFMRTAMTCLFKLANLCENLKSLHSLVAQDTPLAPIFTSKSTRMVKQLILLSIFPQFIIIDDVLEYVSLHISRFSIIFPQPWLSLPTALSSTCILWIRLTSLIILGDDHIWESIWKLIAHLPNLSIFYSSTIRSNFSDLMLSLSFSSSIKLSYLTPLQYLCGEPSLRNHAREVKGLLPASSQP